MPNLHRAWISLLVLGAASTILSIAVSRGILSGGAATAGGAAILALTWAKARLILNAYLGLAAAPAIGRGFGLALGLYAALLLGLYLSA